MKLYLGVGVGLPQPGHQVLAGHSRVETVAGAAAVVWGQMICLYLCISAIQFN